MAWRVRFFQTARGDRPVEQFIREQEETVYARILHSILILEERGPFLKPPDIKKLQSNLYELRISGKSAIRIFYTIKRKEYILLHAFKKKSQKTPTKELKAALDRLRKVI